MAFAFVQRAFVNPAGAGPVPSLTATLAATPTSGNLLIALHECQGAPTVTPPAGWTAVGPSPYAYSVFVTVGIWYRIAGASEPTSVTWSTSTSVEQDLEVLEYSGNASTGVLEDFGVSDTGVGASPPLVTDAVTTTVAGELIVVVMGQAWNAGVWANSWTNGFARSRHREAFYESATLIQSSAGSVGTEESWSPDSKTASVIAAFKPAVGGGTSQSLFALSIESLETFDPPGGHFGGSFGGPFISPVPMVAMSAQSVGAIPTAEDVRSPSLVGASVLPTPIPSAERVSLASQVVLGVAAVLPSSIPSAEVVAAALEGFNEQFPEGFIVPTPFVGVTVHANGVESAEAQGDHNVVLAGQAVTPLPLASAEAFGSARLGLQVVPVSMESAEAVGVPFFTGVFIDPVSIRSLEVVPSPFVQPGVVGLVPESVSTRELVGTVALTTPILTAGVGSLEHVESPSVKGLGVVLPSPVASLEQFGSASLRLFLRPPSVLTAEAVPQPLVLLGVVLLQPSSIARAEALGTPALSLRVLLSAVESAEVVPAPGFSGALAPISIGSMEALGAPLASLNVSVIPDSVSVTEAMGTPVLTLPSYTVAALGVESAEAVSMPHLRLFLGVDGIGSTDTAGEPSLSTHARVVPSSAEVGEAWPTPTIVLPPYFINVDGIVSIETLVDPTVLAAYGILPAPIASLMAFGPVRVSGGAGRRGGLVLFERRHPRIRLRDGLAGVRSRS